MASADKTSRWMVPGWARSVKICRGGFLAAAGHDWLCVLALLQSTLMTEQEPANQFCCLHCRGMCRIGRNTALPFLVLHGMEPCRSTQLLTSSSYPSGTYRNTHVTPKIRTCASQTRASRNKDMVRSVRSDCNDAPASLIY